ncbi:wax ester/triacylglycerol synthase family O-acyltransferase [Nitriliruptoraceae bacterium ZYF776]|nr:wax ester/triacylglycerol synthase family O-acyltransferase [Profundirhabdus halotolerans]
MAAARGRSRRRRAARRGVVDATPPAGAHPWGRDPAAARRGRGQRRCGRDPLASPVAVLGGAQVDEQHGERLPSVDATFLEVESETLHRHVGGLFVFDPPADDADAWSFPRFVELVRSRLHLLPRYRRKLATPPLGLGHPVWIDDPEFDLGYHVRHAALPAPGTTRQLAEYAARIMSRRLDRSRPLWELYVIEGLEDGRFALLDKSHLAVVDGVAGMDIASVLLDVAPEAARELPSPEPWLPRRPPSRADLARGALVDLASSPAAALEAGRRLARTPSRTLRRSARVATGLAALARTNLARPAPRSVLNQPPGPHRRFALQRLALDDVKLVKDTFGTTVTDVVLAVVADATGRHLRARGSRTDGVWLRALVPVSTREGGEGHGFGSRVVSVLVPLPMAEMDPVERLRVCQEGMADVRSSHRAVGAEFLVGLTEFAPPTLHAMASRTASRSRLYNFLVTNVPGPSLPVYCRGARLIGAFPFTSLDAHQSYGVGVTSVDGWLDVGLTADYDVVSDLEPIAVDLVDAVAELRRHAEAAGTRQELARRRGPRS